MRFLHKLISAETREEKFEAAHSLETVDQWQSLRTGLGAYAACPRCFEVCPVGDTFKQDLSKSHAQIPERTPAKRQRLQEMVQAERKGDQGLLDKSARWIGTRPLRGSGCEEEQ